MFIGKYLELDHFLTQEKLVELIEKNKGSITDHDFLNFEQEITFPTYGAAMNFYHGLVDFAQEHSGLLRDEIIRIFTNDHPSNAEKI